MFNWITDYIHHVEDHPKEFGQDVKDNVRQIKELISRPTIHYKEADLIAFQKFARLFKHREGIWAGQPIELSIEQRYIVACVLGIKVWNNREKRYVRYFNEMDIFVARKWGKDTFTTVLICYFVGLDKEPSAWAQIVAENEEQARRTFRIIQENIKEPPLCYWFSGTGKTAREITCEATNGLIQYLSGRTKGKDGANPSVGLVNEGHEITKLNQYTAIKTGMVARSQAMMIVISSAGITPESLYEFLLLRNRKMLRKKKLGRDDRIFALMYSIDDDDDYRDGMCWIKANPGMPEGRPTLSVLRSQFAAIGDDIELRNAFISKNLNRLVGIGFSYYDVISIRNSMRKIMPSEYTDSYAVGGVDLAETTDLCNATAMVLTSEKLLVLQVYFIAEQTLERNSEADKQDYFSMTNLDTGDRVTSELVVITPGAYVRKEYVTDWFVMLRDVYKINFLKIGYDRALAKEWLTNMIENGFSHEKVEKNKETGEIERDYGILTEVAQGGWTLSEPIKITRRLIEMGKIVADSRNKLFVYCFNNLKIRQDVNNNLSPHKAKSTGHIDGAIGVLNAFVGYDRAKNLKEYQEYLSKYFCV